MVKRTQRTKAQADKLATKFIKKLKKQTRTVKK